MSANSRIQWLHKKLTQKSYPNSQRLAERFHISHRQAQRDLDFLRNELKAPVAYDRGKRGFYYTEAFKLPVLLTTDNDDTYISEAFRDKNRGELAADDSIIQMQIPYTATVRISDKLATLELARYNATRTEKDTYLCEFHSIQKFMAELICLEADFEILEPDWLKERILERAKRVLFNNETSASS